MTVQSTLKPAFWGAAGGALAVLIVGFGWGGWVTNASAEQRAEKLSASAVVLALTPICVERFQQQPDNSTLLAELKKAGPWEQGSFVEKGGWATMPGRTDPNSAVAKSCAETLNRLPNPI